MVDHLTCAPIHTFSIVIVLCTNDNDIGVVSDTLREKVINFDRVFCSIRTIANWCVNILQLSAISEEETKLVWTK